MSVNEIEKELPQTNPSLESVEETLSPLVEAPLEEELLLLKDQLLRALAETDNIRKRSEREKDDVGKYAVTKFARDLLPVADTFAAALGTLTQDLDPKIQVFVDGIKMAEKELKGVFERHGIQVVNPLNEAFDHGFHQAMFETETTDVAPGTVLQVLQVGYRVHDRLLRPALVAVAKAPS